MHSAQEDITWKLIIELMTSSVVRSSQKSLNTKHSLFGKLLSLTHGDADAFLHWMQLWVAELGHPASSLQSKGSRYYTWLQAVQSLLKILTTATASSDMSHVFISVSLSIAWIDAGN